jgi:hypothetical protein
VVKVHPKTGQLSANYISFRSDLLHMDKELKIAYGKSWKWRRMSWIRNSEVGGL